jgi:hypothetical protein
MTQALRLRRLLGAYGSRPAMAQLSSSVMEVVQAAEVGFVWIGCQGGHKSRGSCPWRRDPVHGLLL